MLAFSLKWDWTCQVTFIISQKLSQKKAISYKWLGFCSLIFSQVLPGTSDNQKLKRSDSHSKSIFSKIILNFMAPQNHLEWECYLSTCLRLNKLKCEEQASFIRGRQILMQMHIRSVISIKIQFFYTVHKQNLLWNNWLAFNSGKKTMHYYG